MSEQKSPTVSVIIPTRGKAALLKQAIASLLAAHDASDLDIVVIEQEGEAGREMIGKEFPDSPVRWMPADEGWSFSQINNVAASTCQADYLLLLNNDTIARKRFLSHMLSAMKERKDVGIVGAKLLHRDSTIQHCGVVFRCDGVPYHIGWGRPDDGTFAPATRDDYYEAVTFACALIRRDVWEALGGLDLAYHFNYEDVDFCLRAREKGWRCFLSHRAVLKHLEGKSGHLRRTEKHSLQRNLKIFAEKWIKTDRIKDATGLRINANAGTFRHHLLNIAFCPSGRSVGVPWWRMELPARKIIKLGLANVELIYGNMPEEKIQSTIGKSDVAVFQGFTSDWLKRIASLGGDRSFRIAYDYDDHPIYMSPFAQSYRHFGVQEINLQADDGSKEWLWRDGEYGFDVQRNMENRQRQLEIFHAMDMLTTSTPPLHEYFRTINSNARLLSNCIDFDFFRHQFTLWQRRPGPVRIGWHGGDNHFHDMKPVGAWLVDYVNSHDVQLVLFGAYYRAAFRGIDPSKVTEEEWVHVEAFPHKLANLGIDLAVIPLADPAHPFMKFNHYKSDIKFLEYSALRIPSLVVEGRAAYACCVNEDNCLTYSSEQEFKDNLDRLVKDSDLRSRLGSRALDWAREYRDLEKNVHRWVDAYESLIHDEASKVEEDSEEQEPETHLRAVDSNAVMEGA